MAWQHASMGCNVGLRSTVHPATKPRKTAMSQVGPGPMLQVPAENPRSLSFQAYPPRGQATSGWAACAQSLGTKYGFVSIMVSFMHACNLFSATQKWNTKTGRALRKSSACLLTQCHVLHNGVCAVFFPSAVKPSSSNTFLGLTFDRG